MKYLLGFCFGCLTLSLNALTLGPSARQEAELFNTFLEAAYAQRKAAPNRFELLQKALKQDPSSAYLKQQLVSEALAANQPQQADPYIDFIDDETSDAQAWATYGAYQWYKNNTSQALQSYEKALALEPEDETILYQYITILSSADPQKAAEELKELGRSYPQIAPAIYGEIGRMYLYHANYPAALEAFNQAIKLDGQDPQLRMGRVAVYEKTNQYFLMLHELEELEKMGYATAPMFAQMGSVFVLVQDLPRAQHYFLKAKELDNGNIIAGYFLSVLAEQQGDYARAVSYIKDTQDYSSSATKQIQVSYLQRKLNQPKESLRTISKAYEQFPDNAEVCYLYAVALYEERKYAKSARILAPLTEKLPDNQEVRLQYAFALEGQKKYKEMETQLGILLEQNPQNAAALNLYAYSLALRNTRLNEAEQYVTRALTVNPQELSFIDTQAWVFYKQGKYKQAADLISSIPAEVLKANPEMAYHAVLIYEALGDKKAYQHYLLVACGPDGDLKACTKKLSNIK